MHGLNCSYGEQVLLHLYIADRNKTTFEYPEEVPNILHQMVPIFFCFIVIEYFLTYLMKGHFHRLNDGLTSIATGVTMNIMKLFNGGMELAGYQWLYEHRILDLDWESPWTWWGAAIGVDFGYYWLHRIAHEISLFWCGHQVHHSSEDYTGFTALRQSAFQHVFTIGIYQPLALLGVPFPALLVHLQLNLLFQLWIHTELVSNLGPLEWIFNTASHHRVHHGANKYCLDKNYAGFLIIWDRMFGTFEAERKDEKITYGLVNQPQTFNPIYLQFFYFKDIFKKAHSMTNWTDFFKALFYGPGWMPGTPRLGDLSTMKDGPDMRTKWDPKISPWITLYCFIHFTITVYIEQVLLEEHFGVISWKSTLIFIIFIFYTFFTIGCIFDGLWQGTFLEVARCVVTVAVLRYHSLTGIPLVDSLITFYFAISTFVWCLESISIVSPNFKKSKKIM